MSDQIIKEKENLLPQSKELPNKNYTEMATIPSERVEISFKDVQLFYEMLSIRGRDVHIQTPDEVCAHTKNISVIYKLLNPQIKRIEILDVPEIEDCLAPVWST